MMKNRRSWWLSFVRILEQSLVLLLENLRLTRIMETPFLGWKNDLVLMNVAFVYLIFLFFLSTDLINLAISCTFSGVP